MLYGTNSAIKGVTAAFGTATKRSKSKRLPACTVLASCTMLDFSRGGCNKNRERMMMYSSRVMFRKDDDNDVARDLLSKSKHYTIFNRTRIYLFLKHNVTLG
jgi:hypothetical protein